MTTSQQHMLEQTEEWARHKKRHEIFGVAVPPELKDSLDGLVSKARVTLTEYFLISGIVTAPSSMQDAKTVINQQIRAWSLPDVGITVTDIHPKVWFLAQGITTNKILD